MTTAACRLCFCSARIVSTSSFGLSSTSRMRLSRNRSALSSMPGTPQGEEERCAAADLALGPDPAAMAVNDALHGGEPDAGAFEFGRRMQPLKRAEQFCGIGHVK